jgi:hypothetical protein
MIALGYSRREEAAQCRKQARGYLHAFRQCRDAGLRACYRRQFRAELGLARALERAG